MNTAHIQKKVVKMSSRGSPKNSTSSTPTRSVTPRVTPPRSNTPRVTPPRTPTGTPNRTPNGSKAGSTGKLVASPKRDQGNHCLSMLGAERYQNQLCTTANQELFSGKPKNPSMYRRPSELGLSTTPMENKSEIKRNFQPQVLGRQHIVKPIPDHDVTYQAAVEEWAEEREKLTESKSHYKNLNAKRPVCQRLNDHLTVGIEGDLEQDSEVRATYKDLNAKRPVINKLDDHVDEIQPVEPMIETSEYRSTINQMQGMAIKGERALPPWLGMEKVTPFGTGQDVTRE